MSGPRTPEILKILTLTTETSVKSRHTHSRACATQCMWTGSVDEKMVNHVAQFTVKVEGLRALRARGQMQCWTLLMRAIKNRTHYYFCSTVEFWCEEFVPTLSQGRTRSGKEHMLS